MGERTHLDTAGRPVAPRCVPCRALRKGRGRGRGRGAPTHGRGCGCLTSQHEIGVVAVLGVRNGNRLGRRGRRGEGSDRGRRGEGSDRVGQGSDRGRRGRTGVEIRDRACIGKGLDRVGAFPGGATAHLRAFVCLDGGLGSNSRLGKAMALTTGRWG